MYIITRNEFEAKMVKAGISSEEVHRNIDDFDSVREVSQRALMRLPSIGFASVEKRLHAFFVVCEYLDSVVAQGAISERDAMCALAVMRFSNSKFNKAIAMFDVRHNRFSVSQLVGMPDIARGYYGTFSDRRW